VPAEAVHPAVTAAGWAGQACFFARFFVQWLASERARRSVVPPSFWWLSLSGAVLVSLYALERGTAILLAGFAVTAAIAVRNLLLAAGAPRLGARASTWAALLLAGVALVPAVGVRGAHSDPLTWLLVGLAGQAAWTARFPLQWWYSERAGRSHFPASFWWLSLVGNGLLLAYALHLGDPVFVLGFLPGPLLQVRNLFLQGAQARHP